MLIPEWEISFVLFWPKQVLAGFWTKLKTQTFYPKVNQIFNQFFGRTCSCKSWQNWFSFSFSFHANNLILLMHLCTFFFQFSIDHADLLKGHLIFEKNEKKAKIVKNNIFSVILHLVLGKKHLKNWYFLE